MRYLFFGDLCITEANYQLFADGSNSIFSKELLEKVHSCDFVSFNLECPLINKDSTPIKKCGPTLGALKDSIRGISLLKPSLVCLSNNHIYDYGFEGLQTTIEALENNKINYVGNIIKGVKNNAFIQNGVSIINVCENEFSYNYKDDSGACCLDSSIYNQITELKNKTKRLIVVFHGGTENFQYPSIDLVNLCRTFVDLGANLVLCQHSHCIGCYEKYHDSTIVYGQGNFLFDAYRNNDVWTHSVGVIYDTNTNEVEFIVTDFSSGTVSLTKEKRKDVLDNLEERSKELQNGSYKKHYEKFCHDRYIKFLCKLRGYSKIRTGIEMFIFKGFFIKLHYRGKRLYALSDVLNCEAHKELIKTSMKDSVFDSTTNK